MKTVTITEQTKIDEVIRSCQFCFVAVADVDATPYVFPMNFGYQDGFCTCILVRKEERRIY